MTSPCNSHSIAPINLPVRPPILPSALLTPRAAPLIAGPAADVTRVSPWEAFDCTFVAVSLDLDAASEAFSVVDACRSGVRERWLRRIGGWRSRSIRAPAVAGIGGSGDKGQRIEDERKGR